MASDPPCFIFSPPSHPPSTKRRRVETQAEQKDPNWPTREVVYRDLWNLQRNKIQGVLDEANETTVDEVVGFVTKALRGGEDKLVGNGHAATAVPVGFVLAGPDTTSHAAFFGQLGGQLESSEDDMEVEGGEDKVETVFVSLNSGDCGGGTSIKPLLKSLIKGVVGEEDNLFGADGKRRYLEYDLDIIIERMKQRRKTPDGLVIALHDSEAFSSQVLMELVELLS
jgi:hypothetical protein